MKIKSIFVLLVIISFLSACAQATPTSVSTPSGPVSATPTSAYPPPGSLPTTPSSGYPPPGTVAPIPTSGAYPGPTAQSTQAGLTPTQQLATLEFVVQTADHTFLVINPNYALGPTYNPAFNGFLPVGGSVAGTAYVLDAIQNKALAIDANGQHDLTFIQNPTNGLALWRGGEGAQPMLAWGTQPSGTDRTTSLMIANPDGTNIETLLTENAASGAAVQLVAELWSADGKSLYFSKEPVGLGGYILFAGASNLYKIDIATRQVTDVIPQDTSQPQTCLDALSGDYRLVADHCTQNVITVRDLQSGSSATIQMQSGFSGYGVIGSARFSPSGDRVAFAMAKHDPNAEQGWVAIGNSSGGVSKIILTGDQGSYYNVLGWLDDQTLLIQSIGINGSNPVNQVLTLSADGTIVSNVIDGVFLTLIDNR
jgi:hypothetical protein